MLQRWALCELMCTLPWWVMRRKLLQRTVASIQSIKFSLGLSIPAVSTAVASLFSRPVMEQQGNHRCPYTLTRRGQSVPAQCTHKFQRANKWDEIFEFMEVEISCGKIKIKIKIKNTLLWQYRLNAEAKYYKVQTFVNTALSNRTTSNHSRYHRDFKYFVENTQFSYSRGIPPWKVTYY